MKQLTDGTNSIIKWDGGFSIDELEQIISKMKELQDAQKCE